MFLNRKRRHQKRAVRNNARNLTTSPLYRTPDEVIEQILTYLHNDAEAVFPERSSWHWFLTRPLCHRLWDVALNTPKFWSTIEFRRGLFKEADRIRARDQIGLYQSRGKTYPVTLLVDLVAQWRSFPSLNEGCPEVLQLMPWVHTLRLAAHARASLMDPRTWSSRYEINIRDFCGSLIMLPWPSLENLQMSSDFMFVQKNEVNLTLADLLHNTAFSTLRRLSIVSHCVLGAFPLLPRLVSVEIDKLLVVDLKENGKLWYWLRTTPHLAHLSLHIEDLHEDDMAELARANLPSMIKPEVDLPNLTTVKLSGALHHVVYVMRMLPDPRSHFELELNMESAHRTLATIDDATGAASRLLNFATSMTATTTNCVQYKMYFRDYYNENSMCSSFFRFTPYGNYSKLAGIHKTIGFTGCCDPQLLARFFCLASSVIFERGLHYPDHFRTSMLDTSSPLQYLYFNQWGNLRSGRRTTATDFKSLEKILRERKECRPPITLLLSQYNKTYSNGGLFSREDMLRAWVDEKLVTEVIDMDINLSKRAEYHPLMPGDI